MPTLIVEDGTVSSASANTYITLAEADTYCSNMAYTSWASLASSTRESCILRAMVYIDALAFKGYKTSFQNPLSWPRAGVYSDIRNDLFGFWSEYPVNEIPKSLKRGLCHAAYEESLEADILLATSQDNIKREKIDIIETEYFSSQPSQKIFTKVLALMSDIVQETGSRMANILRT